jgi:hypothetical protein
MVSGEVMACHVARATKIVPFLHSMEGKGDVVVDGFTRVSVDPVPGIELIS